jgi:hypothetical protein
MLAWLEQRQQNDFSVREFQGVAMGGVFVLVDLPEDCSLVIGLGLTPRPLACKPNFLRKGQLGSRQ